VAASCSLVVYITASARQRSVLRAYSLANYAALGAAHRARILPLAFFPHTSTPENYRTLFWSPSRAMVNKRKAKRAGPNPLADSIALGA
jgi:hypothetical protein